MRLVLEPAAADHSEILNHLMQFYFYDFTAYLNIQLQENGKYQPYPGLNQYLDDADSEHEAFIFRYDDQIAGFALVDHSPGEPEDEHYMAEFFVLKRFRRQGIGQSAAHALFDRYSGRWSISQLAANTRAQAFWRFTVSAYTGGSFREEVREGTGNTVQHFVTQLSR